MVRLNLRAKRILGFALGVDAIKLFWSKSHFFSCRIGRFKAVHYFSQCYEMVQLTVRVHKFIPIFFRNFFSFSLDE